MQEPFSPADLKARVGRQVRLEGWVHDVRALGGISFVLLRNSRGVVQVAVPKKAVPPELFALVSGLHQEDVISCVGEVKESKAARMGFEILPSSIDVVARAAAPLPLDPRGVTPAALDTRLEWRSLELRRPETAAVFTIENALVQGFEEYLQGSGFIRAFTPSIIGGVSEGGSEVFKIDYYGREAFLRQDPQLHRQLTIAGGFDRVYDLGANWRAELSHTPRHLSEHRTIAPEMGFVADEKDVMRVEEEMMVHGIEKANKSCSGELSLLKRELPMPELPLPEIDFPEVYGILESKGKKLPRGEDLDEEAKDVLAAYAKEEHGSDFFFVNRFPSKPKPFYIMRYDDDPEFARSTDFFFGSLELSSGGQREHRHEKIMAQIKEKGMDAKALEWFTEPFRYGVPPHGGFSFGIERFAAKLLGIENVKEAVLFPRDPERLQP
ncbi:MAG: aspartate--tRNA(Asn) ligase [Nitrososphaerota archaeon]|nr:aspartate--tRNA(Asn) ligase [Nitrososphaerota archaeon]MDG6913317.1 aspartate--tRNA(Asn) ligase [Nitrososphaerota archaeon]MDG6937061.1 aspartate--tRNA(Asn) ligase [Nitrososphaerota archaeon]MDG6961136.1 aspartate--tRNA(Asn) ligase [Nitrososphaerota archaeon]MDG6968136.1 aspartate--tRNA(Asn) ligase [Nitrososphaerota archaeon]